MTAGALTLEKLRAAATALDRHQAVRPYWVQSWTVGVRRYGIRPGERLPRSASIRKAKRRRYGRVCWSASGWAKVRC